MLLIPSTWPFARRNSLLEKARKQPAKTVKYRKEIRRQNFWYQGNTRTGSNGVYDIHCITQLHSYLKRWSSEGCTTPNMHLHSHFAYRQDAIWYNVTFHKKHKKRPWPFSINDFRLKECQGSLTTQMCQPLHSRRRRLIKTKAMELPGREHFRSENFGGKSRATSAWSFTYNHTEILINKIHTEAVYTPTELTLLFFPIIMHNASSSCN